VTCAGSGINIRADLAELAAVYAHGLATGHPFHDGNKRIAFVAMPSSLS
jgi:prophage maintenance system killer protein